MVKFDELLGNKSIVKLLDFFIYNTNKEFSQIKIKEKSEKVLPRLVERLKCLQ